MKNIFFVLLFSVLITYTYGQDKIWLCADNYLQGTDPRWGLTGMKFLQDSIEIQHVLPQNMSLIQFTMASASASDSVGNLLFYTNGLTIFNALHDTMQNAKWFNSGTYVSDSLGDTHLGVVQSVIILPHPKLNYLYYLFHSVPEIKLNATQANSLKYSVVDMRLDSGRGAVVEKNVPIINDWICKGYITACKHANGKDWWIISPKLQQGAYYRTLLTSDSISTPIKQVIGPAGPLLQQGFARFSPDGTKYFLTGNSGYNVFIFDFDRCKGLLSNLQQLPIPTTQQEGLYGISISPNSRYLYINSLLKIFQYDLYASDIATSKQIVANYDGYVCSFPPNPQAYGNSGFLFSQIGPNEKIYYSSTGGTNVYHVIDYPDSAGLACHVRQHGMVFPAFTNFSIPNFPNYRLSALSQPCYGVGIEDEIISGKEIVVYPNPATQRIYIETTSIQGRGELLIYNALGQEVYKEKAVFSEGETAIYIGDLPNGAYYLRVLGEKGVFYGKFFKE